LCDHERNAWILENVLTEAADPVILAFLQINTAFLTLAVEPVNVLSRISNSDPFRRFAAATRNKKLPKVAMFKQGLQRWWQRSNGLFGSHTEFAENWRPRRPATQAA
jgi:hypothetical protein